MPVNVAAVSYLNTIPFLYGLKQSAVAKDMRLTLVPPAQCADLLEQGAVDLSLTPVAAIPRLPACRPVGNYCIGAVRPVRTVVLLSNTPVTAIETIYLDPHSRTSAVLVRLLAKYHWQIAPAFLPLSAAAFPLKATEACMLIGDKVFAQEQEYTFCYDLAAAWLQLTGKPFVFAVWMSTRRLEPGFLHAFNEALAYGVSHIPEAIAAEGQAYDSTMAADYLTRNIDYAFDPQKQAGLQDFLTFMNQEKL